MLFDEKCLDLARHFMPDASPIAQRELAEMFQQQADWHTENYAGRRAAYERADAWNAKHPPGSTVVIELSGGRTMESVTDGEAWVSGAGNVCVCFRGQRGGVRIDQLKVRET